jgi:hypothetical protein
MLRAVFLILCLVVMLASDAVLWLRVWRIPPGQERTAQLIGAVGVLVAFLIGSFTVFMMLTGRF